MKPVCLVIGAGAGIGGHVGKRFALEGYHACLCRRTDTDGLDTIVGEHGQQLSVGERQRLAVARAFLARPAILILDEATGALDPVSEKQVLAGHNALMSGRTTVIITHRSALAKQADRIIVIRDGHIAEDGPATELATREGPFQALFATEGM